MQWKKWKGGTQRMAKYKALSTGNPLIIERCELEADISN